MFVNGRLQFDGESHDVESFLKLFVYEALMFSWDREAQVKAIECCLKGKALQIFNGLSASVKGDIDEVMKALKDGCRKSPDYYLNLFYMRVLKPDETIASFCHDIEFLLSKGMPGLEEASKSSLLRARLIANVPENVKNFMELLSDKSWKELVNIFDKSVDYKSITSKVDDEAILVNQLKATSIGSPKTRFSGTCFYCKKAGHRISECRKRESDEKSGRVGSQRKFEGNNRNRSRSPHPNHVRFDETRRSESDSYKKYESRNDGSVRSKKNYAFSIDAEPDDVEFETKSLEFIEYNGVKVNKLERVNMNVQIGWFNTRVNMLVDSGSSGSFINPNNCQLKCKFTWKP